MFKYQLVITTDCHIQVAYFKNYFEMYSYLEREINRFEEATKPNRFFPASKKVNIISVKHNKIDMTDYYNQYMEWLNKKYSNNYYYVQPDKDDAINFAWSLYTGDEWNEPYSMRVISDNLAEMTKDDTLFFE